MPRSSSRRGRGRGRGRGRSSSRGGGRGWGRGRGTRRYFASLEWQQEQDRKNGVVRVVKGPDGQFHPLSWRQGDTLELGDEHGTVAQVLHNRQVCDKIRTVTSEKVGYKNASFRRALRDGLEVLAKLRHVETMHLKDCHAATVAGLEGCTTLRELHFEDSGMTDLGQLGEKLIALETLRLDSCAHVVHLTALGRSKSLRTVKLAWCSSLVSIAGLAECTSLETLMIKFCHQIHDYDTLRNCVSLRSLEIEGSELVDTVGFGCIPNLETLTLTGIFNKDMGDHLCASTTLRALDVTFLGSTLSFDGLDCIPTLQTLRLHGTEVTSWSFLANCVALQEVWLRGFSVPPSDLESACRSLQQLRALRVEGRKNCWPSLQSVCRAVAQAKSLTMLSLSHTSCKGGLDNSLSQLATLPNLQTIDLNGTRSFRDAFDQLAQITSLTKVDVSFTQAGENIVDVLAKLPALQEAVLTGCPKAHGKVSLLKHVPLVFAGKASTCLGEKRTVKDDETKLREESRGRGRGGARGRGRGW